MTTQRRRRTWTTSSGLVTLTALGQAGQLSLDIGAQMRTKIGIVDLAGMTVARSHLCVQVRADASNATGIQNRAFIGLGIYTALIDDGDFPDLQQYDGDWYGYECMAFQGGGVDLPVVPESAGFFRADYKSMRKLRSRETAWIVFQQILNDDFDYSFIVSTLWLMP